MSSSSSSSSSTAVPATIAKEDQAALLEMSLNTLVLDGFVKQGELHKIEFLLRTRTGGLLELFLCWLSGLPTSRLMSDKLLDQLSPLIQTAMPMCKARHRPALREAAKSLKNCSDIVDLLTRRAYELYVPPASPPSVQASNGVTTVHAESRTSMESVGSSARPTRRTSGRVTGRTRSNSEDAYMPNSNSEEDDSHDDDDDRYGMEVNESEVSEMEVESDIDIEGDGTNEQQTDAAVIALEQGVAALGQRVATFNDVIEQKVAVLEVANVSVHSLIKELRAQIAHLAVQVAKVTQRRSSNTALGRSLPNTSVSSPPPNTERQVVDASVESPIKRREPATPDENCRVIPDKRRPGDAFK